MLNFAMRNLKMYFRQRSTFISSLMGVMIIIALYALFLGDMYTIDGVEGAKQLLDTWTVSGLIAIAPFTTAVGALSTMVDDRTNGNLRDFYASPVKRVKIVGGYILSGLSVAFILSVLSFALGEVYIVMRGGELLSAAAMLEMVGAIMLSVLLSGTMGFFLVCFVGSTNAYVAISGVIGSMTGFLTGMYMPVGQLGEKVQWLVKLFPVTHTTVIIRQIMCRSAIETSFAGAQEFAEEYERIMGVTLTFGDYTMPTWMHCAIVAALSVIFFSLSVIRVSRDKRK